MYADEQSYEELKSMGAQYVTIKSKVDSEEALVEQFKQTVPNVLRNTIDNIAKPMRAKLGLKKIVLKN